MVIDMTSADLMSTDESNWDLEAAEYVLGTQSDENSRVYDALYKVDADWQQRVHFWQERLNPLHASTAPVQPSRDVLEKVLERIDDAGETASPVSDISANDSQALSLNKSTTENAESADPHGSNDGYTDEHMKPTLAQTLEQWRERARYWQLTSLLAMVAIAAIVFVGPKYLDRQQQTSSDLRTVAVLQDDANAPLWVISHLPQSATDEMSIGSVLVSALGETPASDQQSHELWMVLPDGTGVESVGLVPAAPGQTVTLALPMTLNEANEFAVSLEPSGGATGNEHGPMVSRTNIIQHSAE